MTETAYTDRSLGILSGDRLFQRLGHGFVWLTIAASGFVMFEPAPYDVLMIILVLLFASLGLPLPKRVAPLLLLLAIIFSGGLMSALVFSTFEATAIHITITGFLGVSAIFMASYIAQNPSRNFALVMNAFCFAALLSSFAAIVGHFNLAGALSESLTLYNGRAKGFFKDPNVLGPFLVAPTVFAFHLLWRGDKRNLLWAAFLALICSLAIFLSFSRGAWMVLVFSVLMYGYLSFVTAVNIKDRFRLMLFAIIGFCCLATAGIGVLSLKNVNALFAQRASLNQTYDSGPLGRFGRHIQGLELVSRSPLGIGAEQFTKIFPEAPHNVYLNSFVISGWAGGLSYLLLIGWTLVIGFRQSLVRLPWQGVYMVCYATFAGISIEGLIIDTDHWRHFYLLLGLVWGGALAPGGVLNQRILHKSPA